MKASHGSLLQAMTRFDHELRDTEHWQGWEQNKAHKYAINHDGKRYPVKQIVSLATGVLVSDFSGGEGAGQANSVVEQAGLAIISLHGANPVGFNGANELMNDAEGAVILSQYRTVSTYKDEIGKLYHFPNRYRSRLSKLPVPFIYYEPRNGGSLVYFGCGLVSALVDDTEDVSQSYAELVSYQPFESPVSYFSGPGGPPWESHTVMRNSVRAVSQEFFYSVCKAGGITPSFVKAEKPGDADRAAELSRELASLPPPGKRNPAVLKKIKRILETYERPSRITNEVKKTRGHKCQLCGIDGFIKRDGGRYCEVHHLFHLADDPPSDCLEPRFLVVLCATCHRRLHYACVSDLVEVAGGWKLTLDKKEVVFQTCD